MKSVAIIGAGIGGCSAAYFLRKYIPNVKLTILDSQERIGGRILTRKIDGIDFELGASFVNGTNRTILDLANTEQLKLNRIEDQRRFAIWNGSKLIFKSDNKAATTNLKLLMRYRQSTVKTLLLLREVQGQISKLYQEEQEKPTDLAELFERAGLNNWIKTTLDKILSEKGISRTFIEELAAPLTRTLYTQNADLGGFAGISSLIGAYGGTIYRFVNGNSTLPAKLAEASQAQVKLNQKVTSIEKNPEEFYKVSTDAEQTVFDGVIIAAPLELSGIKLDGINKPTIQPQEYQKIYTKIMRGTLNPGYFGLNDSAGPPTIVLTTKEADPITHFGIQKTQNQFTVTMSSAEPIDDNKFDNIFKDGRTPVLNHNWPAAYPKFKPALKLPMSQLDSKLIYLNSIETAVSSMEAAALSALNATKTMKNALQ